MLKPEQCANLNLLWGSLLAESFHRLGGRHAVLSPGSRNAPLAYGFALHDHLRTHVLLDERSASFFALGLAKQTGQPTALISTSGTAAANFLPAIVEARESAVPLLVLTADRPPEARDCQAGQAIDQLKLYGHFPVWQTELALPQTDLLDYLRARLAYGFARSLGPQPGPVHFNIPFRDPLHPEPQPLPPGIGEPAWLEQWARPLVPPLQTTPTPDPQALSHLRKTLCAHRRGLIIVGNTAPTDPSAHAQQLIQLSTHLGWPVLDGGLSGARTHPKVLSHYEPLLEDPHFLETHAPEITLVLGPLPTSKRLRAWLETLPCPHLVLEPTWRAVDPTHRAQLLPISLDTLLAGWDPTPATDTTYAQAWENAHRAIVGKLELRMNAQTTLSAEHIPWHLSHLLPEGAQVLCANSLSIRHLESHWRSGGPAYRLFANRGANGIDGTLSTALGLAEAAPARPTYFITGDLTLLHDTNALLHARQLTAPLTLIVLNNNGGGIFRNLPIARYSGTFFEDHFLTPQHIDLVQLCATYGVTHHPCADLATLERLIRDPHTKGIRLLEVPLPQA